MGRSNYEGEQEWRKGPWTPQEDKLLLHYISTNDEGRWRFVSKCTGLKRSGKSCRIRWVNYLRPDLKKGHLTPQEQAIIIELHALWGNKWSTIARHLPGRTDNEIKNYWRTHFKIRKPCQMKQEKRKFVKKQQQSDSDHTNNISNEYEPSELAAVDHDQIIKKVGEIGNHDQEMMFNQEYYSTANSDFNIPFDCYLWGGLWNLDDQTQLPIKVDDSNNYCNSFQGDYNNLDNTFMF